MTQEPPREERFSGSRKDDAPQSETSSLEYEFDGHPGLTPEQVEDSRRRFGLNELTPPPRDPWWRLYLQKFDDPIIRILLVAAFFATMAGFLKDEHVEGPTIIVTIFLATFVGFFNEFRASKEFDLLVQARDESPVKIIRGGAISAVMRRELVVGDIVLVETGDEIPADARLLKAVSLKIDESSLTGESFPVKKNLISSSDGVFPADRVLRGTLVAEGHGMVEVTAVGDATELGKTARSASEAVSAPSPLTVQLDRLSRVISSVGSGTAALIFATLAWRGWLSGTLAPATAEWVFLLILGIGAGVALLRIWLPMVYDFLAEVGFEVTSTALFYSEENQALPLPVKGLLFFAGLLLLAILGGFISASPREWLLLSTGREILKYILVVVAIIVVAVPEGLGMAVTLALAYGMRRMMSQNILVRRLQSCETVGAVTVICSDKTGTLTMNRMRLAESVWAGNSHGSGTFSHEFWAGNFGRLVAEGIAANSTAHLCVRQNESVSLGNPTEGALLIWLKSFDIDYLRWRSEFVIERQWAFSPERKYMATLGWSPELKEHLIYVKGAPEAILERCAHVWGEPGLAFAQQQRSAIEQQLLSFQKRGMRTLAFAFRPHSPAHSSNGFLPDDVDQVAVDLVWLGFVAIHDQARPEAAEAIRLCQQAGVAVKMVTGDNPETAMEIARQTGLWNNERKKQRHLTGPEFEKLDDVAAKAMVSELTILSRAKPLDKLRLVRLLREQGEVVAVTGDGTNDAPALNAASVGLAMGRSGTDMAREASDIILLDDSFSSIVTAIMWGRSLYLNIQRFLIYQISVNIIALGTTLIGPLLGTQLPLTVVQMLWVNLIMDTFAALALATEPPQVGLMDRPPRMRDDFIISWDMVKEILPFSLIALVFFNGLLFFFLRDNPEDHHLWTLYFSLFVFAQFWNLFNVRNFGLRESGLAGVFQNRAFLLIVVVIFIGQVLMVQFGGDVLRVVPLSFADWLWVILGTSLVFGVGEIRRFIFWRE